MPSDSVTTALQPSSLLFKPLESLAPRWPSDDPQVARAAAVALIYVQTQDTIILTRRTNTVRTHRGQVGLPGGHRETNDLSPVATASREAAEEIGLNLPPTSALGQAPATRSIDGNLVIPVVFVISSEVAVVTPNPDEVAQVVFVPRAMLLPSAGRRFAFNVFGRWRDSWIFQWQNLRVWGLTAEILVSALADEEGAKSIEGPAAS